MSDVTIHNSTRRYESGGILKITGLGADPLIVAGVMPGSLNFTKPGRGVLPYANTGVQQVPQDGDDENGKISFDVRGSKETTNHLMKLLTAAPSGPTVTEFTVSIKIPDGRGATTGLEYASTTCFRTELPTFKAGTDFDTISIFLGCRTMADPATYGS